MQGVVKRSADPPCTGVLWWVSLRSTTPYIFDSSPVSDEGSEPEPAIPGPEDAVQRLYTPAMLAELLGVPIAAIRRWHRAKLIVPSQEVRRLPYFDVPEVATAQRLAQLLRAGVSPQHIERKVADLARLLPGVERPLLEPSVIVQGQSVLVRQGDGLVEAGGQLRFDFEGPEFPLLAATPEVESSAPPVAVGVLRSLEDVSVSAEQMRSLAVELEDAGRLSDAADVLRAAMAAAGPDPEGCFQLAELLYRQGDLGGARERTTWPWNWMRTTSRPGPTWAACWPRWAGGSWRSRPSKAHSAITPTTPTPITIWRGCWTRWGIGGLRGCIGEDSSRWPPAALGRPKRARG